MDHGAKVGAQWSQRWVDLRGGSEVRAAHPLAWETSVLNSLPNPRTYTDSLGFVPQWVCMSYYVGIGTSWRACTRGLRLVLTGFHPKLFFMYIV